MRAVQFLLFFHFLFFYTAAFAGLISEGVGQVGDQVFTSREIQIEHMIGQALDSQVLKPLVYPIPNIRSDSTADQKKNREVAMASWSTEVSNYMLEKVMSLEAKSLNFADIDKSEFKEEWIKAEKALANHLDWKNLEVGKAEAESILRDKLQARKFLKYKTASLSVEVSDEEAKIYFEKNRLKFGNLPFENFKANIKTYLSQQQLEEKLKAWFEVVKRKYRVKLIAASRGEDSRAK